MNKEVKKLNEIKSTECSNKKSVDFSKTDGTQRVGLYPIGVCESRDSKIPRISENEHGRSNNFSQDGIRAFEKLVGIKL